MIRFAEILNFDNETQNLNSYSITVKHLLKLNSENKMLFQEYGDLTVISKVGNYKGGNIKWLCSCKCGNTKIANRKSLRNSVRSCNYCVPENFKGKHIGSLTVFDRTEDKINNKGNPVIMWKCLCDCGAIVTKSSRLLRRGNCGCPECRKKIDHKRRKFVGNIPISHFNYIRREAIKRGLAFDITIQHLDEIFTQQNSKCTYSGDEIFFGIGKKDEQTASLDRIDSSQGYVIGNVQWVHKAINRMKLDHSDTAFREWVRKIAANERLHEKIKTGY